MLFKGRLEKLHGLWSKGAITPIISKETFRELKTVLEYPKFSLNENEISAIIEDEILPYFKVQEITRRVRGVCKDRDDDKFLSCALSAGAGFVVTGDNLFYDLKKYQSIKIIKPADLLKMF